jgi:hypothetical protein
LVKACLLSSVKALAADWYGSLRVDVFIIRRRPALFDGSPVFLAKEYIQLAEQDLPRIIGTLVQRQEDVREASSGAFVKESLLGFCSDLPVVMVWVWHRGQLFDGLECVEPARATTGAKLCSI